MEEKPDEKALTEAVSGTGYTVRSVKSIHEIQSEILLKNTHRKVYSKISLLKLFRCVFYFNMRYFE